VIFVPIAMAEVHTKDNVTWTNEIKQCIGNAHQIIMVIHSEKNVHTPASATQEVVTMVLKEQVFAIVRGVIGAALIVQVRGDVSWL
jgi:hypothetical protein